MAKKSIFQKRKLTKKILTRDMGELGRLEVSPLESDPQKKIEVKKKKGFEGKEDGEILERLVEKLQGELAVSKRSRIIPQETRGQKIGGGVMVCETAVFLKRKTADFF